jgi:ABC-type branched-subunit amino acid transport system ATPase component
MSAPTLSVQAITRSFGGLRAVSDLTLTVEPGLVTALLGPNGAGKSTIFNLVSGFLRPDAGSIWYGETRLDRLPAYRIARLGIGRFFQEVRLFQRMNGLENIELALQQEGDESIVRMVLSLPRRRARERELAQAARNHLEGLQLGELADLPVGAMSYGQQKLLAMARLLALDADVLLLDEPLAGLSPIALDRMLEIVQAAARSGRTVLLIEHNLEAVRRIADQIIFMGQGRVLAQGAVDEVLANPLLAEEYLGASV